MKKEYQKKVKLAVAQRQTKWAPFWAVLRKAGKGKRAHPSQITVRRRHWRRTKLKIKPRRAPRSHLG
ncbi:50S ribosomal protein L39e [Candidatus Pacearchaeota archaeon]|nr:50S ribosomal protein L39e [Candidatus Pacearchaeota archaeon]